MSVLPYQVRSTPRRTPALAQASIAVCISILAALAPIPAIATEPHQLVIAHIDGSPITGADFAPYLRPYLRSKLYHSGSPERVRALADEAIDAFLVDRVLAEQAVARGLKIDEAEVKKRLAGIEARYRDRAGWTEIRTRLPKLRQEIEADLRIEALKSEISRVQPLAEAEVRAFYDSQSDLFTRPAGYRLRLLLVAVDPGGSADEWRAAEVRAKDYVLRIGAGENFAALAAAKSQHSSAEQGGAVGLVHEGQLGEAADAALRPSKPGDVVGPVRLLEGIAIFQIEDKLAAQLMPFSEVKERASTLLQRDQAKKQWNAYVETIRSRFSIDRNAFAEFIAGAIK